MANNNKNETIGQVIKRSRKDKSLTLLDLSRKTGLSMSTLSRFESGVQKNGISFDELFKVAVALDDLYIIAEHCLRCPVRSKIMLPMVANDIKNMPARL